MPSLDSLNFALLVLFGICFVLLFVICCCADKIKEICRFPSPLPTNYIAIEHERRRHTTRHVRPRANRRERPIDADDRILIIHEEGRSRNASESSNASGSNSNPGLIRSQVRLCPPSQNNNTSSIVLNTRNFILTQPASNNVLSTGCSINRNIGSVQPSHNMDFSNNSNNLTRGSAVGNMSVPEHLNRVLVHAPRSLSTNALRNLPEIIPHGLMPEKKV